MIRRLVALTFALAGLARASEEYSFNTLGSSTGSSVGKVEPASDSSDYSQQQSTNDSHIQQRIRSGEVEVRGVNLGSWLVAEKWMTSDADIWQNVDANYSGGGEFIVMKHGKDRKTRRSRFDNHHNTFITEKDIAAIAATGLNTVRVPVGYWILGEDKFDANGAQEWKVYPNGTLKYLDRLIKKWALKYNVAVFISIHGAKGSQNGADHSAPTRSDRAYWSEFPENVNNTIYLAKFLAGRYKDESAFLGMGLLNEPNGNTSEAVVNQYYLDAYDAVRSTGSDCILSIMPMLSKQDATNLNGFMEAPKYTNVWVEWHPYFIWGYDQVSADDLINTSISDTFQKKVEQWNSRANSNKLFFGEWCLANTGQFTDPDSTAFENWTKAQIKVMNMAKGGWTYWSWRVYGDDVSGSFNAWSMRNVMAKPALSKIIISSDATQS